MLVTFQSRAAPDVVMLRDLAQYLLGIVGRRLDTLGVISHDELPKAIERMEAEIAAAGRREVVLQYAHDRDYRAANQLSQRAWPFINMMREAEKQHADIIWGL
jgi:phosphate uptake regulator